MNHTLLNRIVAAGAFIASMAIYIITLPPTVVFWDVGEFIAAADMLQVPHPPGSPLFLLVTRIALMIPFAADVAVRAHALSALCSALGVMFLYLIIVKLLMNFRGMPGSLSERIIVYGSAFLGSMTLAFSTTYWDNSTEAEVYGFSMLFLCSILWLAMRWHERADREGNEKYILFIAYLIGLSIGVHLLALLAIFPVLMIVYFRKYEINARTLIWFMIIAIATFLVVYPGIVKYIPGMMDGEFRGTKNDFIRWLPWLLILLSGLGVYSSYKKKQRIMHIALLSAVLIFVGYSTYTMVIIRSNAKPPMNENDPSTIARLTSYLGREQYGQAPLFFPRRYSQEPHQQGIYKNYTSDMDFMLRYQINHMFNRYLLWNFVGIEGDYQDAGPSANGTWMIPFLMGLGGFFYHFKRDWKMWLVFLTIFVILGPILALYQNQQEPQPRERDYFYVGAFFVFAIWVAMGVVALIDLCAEWIGSLKNNSMVSGAFVGAFFLIIPVNLVRVNWETHDHSGNYVAWDYSYNILQTCEKDAILFTNGDNDTFPLWYLQDVEGVRRDVRIVNLSLVNTPWYIQQMKDPPYYAEAKPVPISLADQAIARIQPILWEPREVDIPVSRATFLHYGVQDTTLINRGKISFFFKNTLDLGTAKAIRVQDRLVHDIIMTNQWKRPVYFAVTVSPDSKIGLEKYLWFHGLAWRLEPRITEEPDKALDPGIVAKNLFEEPEGFSMTPQYGYKWRNIANLDVYFDENASRLMVNYRAAFIRLALYYSNVALDSKKSSDVLDKMEETIPRSKIPLDWSLKSDIATFYSRVGNMERFNELADELIPECRDMIVRKEINWRSYYNPYRILLEIFETRKDYANTLEILRDLAVIYPNDASIKQRINEAESRLKGAPPDTGQFRAGVN